jgi:hypothetical protein
MPAALPYAQLYAFASAPSPLYMMFEEQRHGGPAQSAQFVAADVGAGGLAARRGQHMGPVCAVLRRRSPCICRCTGPRHETARLQLPAGMVWLALSIGRFHPPRCWLGRCLSSPPVGCDFRGDEVRNDAVWGRARVGAQAPAEWAQAHRKGSAVSQRLKMLRYKKGLWRRNEAETGVERTLYTARRQGFRQAARGGGGRGSCGAPDQAAPGKGAATRPRGQQRASHQ